MDGKPGGFCGAVPSKARLRVTLSPTGTTLRSSVALKLAADAMSMPSNQTTLRASAFDQDTRIVRISPKLMPVWTICRKFVDRRACRRGELGSLSLSHPHRSLALDGAHLLEES